MAALNSSLVFTEVFAITKLDLWQQLHTDYNKGI